jgi:shikimate O-hydroxycinnamoyltransferase
MTRAESVLGGFVQLMNDEGGGGTGNVCLLVSMEPINIKELGRLLYAKL